MPGSTANTSETRPLWQSICKIPATATGAVVANVRMCNHVYGLARGFDTYIDYPWNQEVSFHTAMSSSKLGATVFRWRNVSVFRPPHHFPLYYRRPARSIIKDAGKWLDGVHSRNESPAPLPATRSSCS